MNVVTFGANGSNAAFCRNKYVQADSLHWVAHHTVTSTRSFHQWQWLVVA